MKEASSRAPTVLHTANIEDEAIEPQQVEQQNERIVSTNNSTLQASTEQIQQNQVSQQYHVTKTKLPKLVLPKFKGDLTKFRSFWDSYDSAVHKNSGLSAIDKFNLQSLLEGTALQGTKHPNFALFMTKSVSV